MPINPLDDAATRLFGNNESTQDVELTSLDKVNEIDFKSSMNTAVKKNPDQQVEYQKYAAQTSLPVDVVERNFDLIKQKKETEYRDLDLVLERNPGLVEWMKDPKNSAVAHDDMDGLAEVENVVKNHKSITDVMSKMDSSMADVGDKALRSIDVGLATASASAARLPGLAYQLAVTPGNLIASAMGRPDLQYEAPDWLLNNPVAKFYDKQAEQYKIPELDISITDSIKKGDYKSAGVALAYQFLSNAPQQAMNLGLALSGNPLVGLGYIGATSASSELAQNQDSGASPVQRTVDAVLNGSIEAGFESLGTFGILKHWEGAITKSLGKDAAREVFKDFAKTIAYSAAGEANEEFLTSVAQDYSQYITGVNPDAMRGTVERALNAGILGAASGGGMTGPTAIFGGVARSKQIKEAATARDFYLSLGDKGSQTKLAQRSPEHLAAAIKTIAENGGGIDSVYISAQKFTEYFQKKDQLPSQVAEKMGITKELSQAEESGGDIKIPLDKWAATIQPGQEDWKALSGDIKFNPEGVSANEAVEQIKKTQEDLKAEMAKAEQPATETEQQQINEVVNEIGVKLQEAGLSTAQKEIGRSIAVLAIRNGENPIEALKGYNLRIGRGELGSVGETYNQSDLEKVKKVRETRKQVSDLLAKQNKPYVRGQVVSDQELVQYGASPELIKQVAEMNKLEQELQQGRSGQLAKTYNQEYAPTFYSKLTKTVEEKMGNSASVEQINGMLREIKPEERKWSGLDEFLKGKEKVSKAELVDFLNANQLEIEEVVKEEYPQEKIDAINARLQEIEAIPDFENDTALSQERKELRKQRTDLSAGETKFGNYQIPGGQNYKEIIFRLPSEVKAYKELPEGWTISPETIDNGISKPFEGFVIYDNEGDSRAGHKDKATAVKRALEQLNGVEQRKADQEGIQFRSSHFDERNILAHTRLNERIDADGKRVLFVEEIQSDWHQAGRKKGYKETAIDTGKLQSERKDIEDKLSALTEDNRLLNKKFSDQAKKIDPKNSYKISEELKNNSEEYKTKEAAIAKEYKVLDERRKQITEQIIQAEKGVPDAPFKKSWHEFVFKRMVRYAAENGFDKIAWTTGEQQAERYDLSKQVDSINYRSDGDNTFEISVLKNGESVITEHGKTASQLEDFIGKEAAAKIVAGEGKKVKGGGNVKSLSGLDLKVGGEGMKGFYDKILVDYANKFGKKYGAKVEAAKILDGKVRSGSLSGTWAATDHGFEATRSDGRTKSFNVEDYADEDAAQRATVNWLNLQETPAITVHSLPLTPELRGAALNEGFTLFQNPNDPLGRITFGPDGIDLNILQKANSSTFIHEMGHFYLNALSGYAARPDANEQTKQDMQILLNWFGIDSADKIGVDQHEMFARGFEKYIGEGKAPSESLKGVFRKFKNWILSVYGDLNNLNVELTDDVRGVFDRLMATESEIAYAEHTMQRGPLFENPAGIGMNEKQAMEYRRAQSDAQDEAREILNTKLLKEQIKKQTAEYKSKKKEIQSEVEDEINKAPAFKAYYALRDGTNPDGSALPEGTPQVKLDKKLIDSEVAKQLPRGIFSKDTGIHPDVAAQAFGFSNGSELIELLKNIPKKQDVIDSVTDQRMKEQYPELLNTPELSKEAIDSLHNDSQAKLLAMEAKLMAENAPGVTKELTKKLIRRVPVQKEVRRQAERMIDDKVVKDLKPYLFKRAEVKAAREAADFWGKGNFEAALEAKRRELLNHELYRATVEASDRVDSRLDNISKLFKSDADIAKTRDMDLVNTARAVLAEYGLARPSEKTADQYLKSLKEYNPDAYNNLTNMVMDVMNAAKNYEQTSFSEFSEMMDLVDSLWGLARETKSLEADGKKFDKQEAILELQARLGDITSKEKKASEKVLGEAPKNKMTLLGLASSLKRVEHWADTVDNGVGPFTKYIWRPIIEGVTQYRSQKSIVVEQYKNLVDSWAKSLANRNPIIAHELGVTFKDKTQLMMAILHTGNESNKSKLVRGYGWGDTDADGVLDSSRLDNFIARMQKEGVLTKADYDFAQSVWDLLETLKPEAQKAHRQMHGHYFKEITADKIVTPFGEYKGGYIPAKVDIYLSEDGKIRQEREEFENGNNSFQFPTTGRGFSKSRVDGYAAPLSLDMGLLGGHIDSVLRFSYIEPRVKQVFSLVSDKGFRQSLAQLDPTIASDMLIPWLQRTAKQSIILPSNDGVGKAVDAAAHFIRKSTAMQIMVGNVSNTLQQFTGMVVAMAKVKPRHIRNSLAQYVMNPKQTSEAIMDKSVWMKTNQGSNIIENNEAIKQILVNPSTFESFKDFVSRHTYFLQTAAQNIVNTIVWSGAYNQAIEEKLSEQEAVLAADAAIRLTQGTKNAEDVSAMETGTQTRAMFLQFTGYFNMLANLNSGELVKASRELGLKKGAGKMLYVYMTAFMIPAVLSEFIMKAMAGKFDEDDDDEYLDDLLAAFFGSQFRTATALVPIAGQLINAGANQFNEKRYDDRLTLSPAVSTLESMIRVPKELYDNIVDDADNEKRLTKDILQFLGIVTQIPLVPIGKPAGYLIDVNDGNAEPEGPVDFMRGLVTGKSGQ